MFSSSRKHKGWSFLFRPRLEILEDRTLLSVCTVDRLTDNNPPGGGGEGGNGMGDLRWCIVESLFRADSIIFEVTGTINLTAALPNLTRSVSIDGPGADFMTVRRGTGDHYGIFTVPTGVTASISGLTISNGYRGDGGGISNSGTLMVNNSTISGNIATSGSGISNSGTLTVNSSTISGNTAYYAGGIYNGGTLTVTNTTISENTAINGGGMLNYSMMTVNDSTISGNSAPQGGGIFNGGTLAITNCTIAGNSATNAAGGIYVGNPMAARNTIIAGNTSPGGPDVFGNLGSQGHNLVGNPQDMRGWVDTDLLHVNPLLGPLQANGGPTKTMALLPGSPAVDAGDNTNSPNFDQRGEGFDRIVGGTIDIGAFEAQIGSATSFRIDAPQSVLPGMPFDVTVTALDAYNHIATGYTGTVTFSSTDLDKGVVLPADYTFMPEEGGVHKFTDTGRGETTLITPGDQTMSATDTKDDSITGNAIVTVTGGNGPRMGRGNPGVGLDWMRSVSPNHQKGSANSENLFFMFEGWNFG